MNGEIVHFYLGLVGQNPDMTDSEERGGHTCVFHPWVGMCLSGWAGGMAHSCNCSGRFQLKPRPDNTSGLVQIVKHNEGKKKGTYTDEREHPNITK